MYCIYCGREIPDGQVCNCRNTQGNYENPGDINGGLNYNPPYGEGAANSQNRFSDPEPSYYNGSVYNSNPGYAPDMSGGSACFESVRKVLKSPVTAIMAVLYTAGCIVGQRLGIIQLLLIIAMWITFAAAHKKDGSVKTAGISIVSGTYVAMIVLQSVLFLVVSAAIAIMLFAPDLISESYAIFARFADLYLGIAMPESIELSTVVVITVIAVWVCMFIIQIVYLSMIRRSTHAVKSAIMKEQPAHNVSVFAAIMLIIGAIANMASSALLCIYIGDINGFVNAVLNQLDLPFNYVFRLDYIRMGGNVAFYIACFLGATILLRLHRAIKKSGEY